MQHEPHEDYLVEEFRHIVRIRYGGSMAGPGPNEVFLVNIDRLAKLQSIVHNPYHQLVIGDLPNIHMMRVCAAHLMERCDFRYAGRLYREIELLAQAAARAGADAPESAGPPAPAAEPPLVYRLDPEALPLRLPVHGAGQNSARGLSDRELARQYAIARRRTAERAAESEPVT